MRSNKFWLRFLIINVICFLALAYFQYMPIVHSQEDQFLSPPYFGTTTVNSIFDHEYPRYTRENDGVFLGDINTMVHNTNERLDNLAAGVVDANRYCVGYSGHDGVDYNLRYEYVLASHVGQVVEAGWDNPANHRLNFGLRVTLQTNDEQYQTIYGHLSTLMHWLQVKQIPDLSRVNSRVNCGQTAVITLLIPFRYWVNPSETLRNHLNFANSG